MALFVFEVLSGLEIDCMTEILTLFKDIDDSRGTPAVDIFEGLILIYSLVELSELCGGNEHLFLL